MVSNYHEVKVNKRTDARELLKHGTKAVDETGKATFVDHVAHFVIQPRGLTAKLRKAKATKIAKLLEHLSCQDESTKERASLRVEVLGNYYVPAHSGLYNPAPGIVTVRVWTQHHLGQRIPVGSNANLSQNDPALTRARNTFVPRQVMVAKAIVDALQVLGEKAKVQTYHHTSYSDHEAPGREL